MRRATSKSDNEIDRLRIRAQQQQARNNEIERFRRRSAPLILERAALHYDTAIDYCADKIKIKIMCNK
ncbi:Uncharacterized protein FWK35_00029063 [Aphis craccivora]|uniref:Uncharacterized protein n=1 Tax=Aphis craccivora TaxID=307492 RepID=A0A6G0Y6U8_APHCR|nr:Uncharacterized protein FWK35_00029063 [Aphis craccivora]